MGILIFEIAEIPDRTYPRYRMLAQGDVVHAVGKDFERLLRAFSNLHPGAASVSTRFTFNPQPEEGDSQSRLKLHVIAQCRDPRIEESVKLLIAQGALSRFYKPRPATNFAAPWNLMKASCDVLRREDALPPLHTHEFNDRIPNRYRTFTSFKPNHHNDYLELDTVLNSLRESVMIDICIQPVNISSEIVAHTRYLAQLQSINRKWDRDEDDGLDLVEYIENGSVGTHARVCELKPLRYTDPLADDILRCQQRFHETLREPHLLFHIRVLSQTPEVAYLVGSVLAGLAFEDGTYQLQFCAKTDRGFDEAVRSVKESNASIFRRLGKFNETGDGKLYEGLSRLPQLATVQELLGAVRLPVASITSPRCIRKNTDPLLERASLGVVFGVDVEVPDLNVSWLASVQTKGGALFGVPGVGKTTAVVNLIIQAYDMGIPFIVFESAKTEYRTLKALRESREGPVRKLAKDLEVYTPGNEFISPLRFNPFELLPGISVDEHIGLIYECFQASMPLEGPLPALLLEALERAYEEATSKGRTPYIGDVVSSAHAVLDEKRYSSETNSNIRAAIEVRLGSLSRLGIGKVFQCRKSIPSFDHLFKVPALIELTWLSLEQACLLILLFLSFTREYTKTVPWTGTIPRYIIIIEEAHNIVGRKGSASPSPDVADPKSFAAEAVCRALLEFRGLGVCVLIVDQFPSSVAPEVVRATTTKLVFRLTEEEDRNTVSQSMLLNSIEREELARLIKGEAFFFTEGFYKSRRIETVNLHERIKLF
jgi:hypothetical protein